MSTDPKDDATEIQLFWSNEKIALSVAIVQNLIATKTKSGKTCSAADALKFIALCKAKGLNPWEGDAFLTGFDTKDGPAFQQITAVQALLKRAEAHPQYDGLESGVIVMDQEDGSVKELPTDFFQEHQVLLGGWAKVYVKDRKIPTYKGVKLETFNTGQARWLKDPGGMISKCARAAALREAFPLALAGMYVGEEMPAPDAAPFMPRPAQIVGQPEAPAFTWTLAQATQAAQERGIPREQMIAYMRGQGSAGWQPARDTPILRGWLDSLPDMGDAHEGTAEE